MDKKQRRQIAEAFKAAKQCLWDGSENSRFQEPAAICYAIYDANNTRVARLACDVVQQRLEGSTFFSQWLERHGVPVEEICQSDRLQAHRHAWLDKLIEEFSA